MEPSTRTRALTAAAVVLTAGFTFGTAFLPSSAHAAQPPAGRSIPTAVQSADRALPCAGSARRSAIHGRLSV